MGNREECPICKDYTSGIYEAFEDNRECPSCGTSYKAIISMKELEQKKKYYQSQKVQNEIIEENFKLKEELILKKEKFFQLKNFCWNMFYEIEKMKDELDKTYMSKMTEWDEK